MASHRSPHPGYQRHQPEQTALYAIVEQRLAKFCAGLAEQDASLPAFVTREFRDYLRCGLLEYGFIRVKCNGCRHEHLAWPAARLFLQTPRLLSGAPSPSCGARRMIETSVHLIDHVIPRVPVRQWVLSFPWPLRMLFASRPQALSRCLAVITRAIQTDLAQRAGPAICLQRLSINSSGQVVYRLKQPFRDGTTHVLFSPEDFIARLAALVPKPGCNLTRYHGVFAPNSAFRRAVVPHAGKRRRRKGKGKAASCQDGGAKPPKSGALDDSDPPMAPLTWAQRLKRVFEFDITLCPHCGGRLRVIADVTDPLVIRKILDHIHQRAPPEWRPITEQYAISFAHG